MLPGMTPALFLSGAAAGYQVARSLRFRSAANQYLNRVFVNPTSRQKMSLSLWIKGTPDCYLFDASLSGSQEGQLLRFTGGTIYLSEYYGSYGYQLQTTQLFRDHSAHMHYLVAVDTTQAVASERMIIYIDGLRVTSFSTANYPAQNQVMSYINSVGNQHVLGRVAWTTGSNYDGYLSEFYFLDGKQAVPTEFGEFDKVTGVWNPIKYVSGNYGNNGCYLDFKDNSSLAALGTDRSGKGNNWTANNFGITAGITNDSLKDTPTNFGSDTGAGGEVSGNFDTFSPLINATGANKALSYGNLRATFTSAASSSQVIGSFWLSSGKWFWEVIIGSTDAYYPGVGITTSPVDSAVGTVLANIYNYRADGTKSVNGAAATAYGAAFAANDVIGLALDGDTGTLTCYKNGVSQGVLVSGVVGPFAVIAISYNNTFVTLNAGQRPFAYPAPAGFKSVCTQNLPDPVIRNPQQYFNVMAYIGNSTPRSLTGLGHRPDFIWIKDRGEVASWAALDALRGATKVLESNSAAVEATDATSLTSFDADGFTLGTGSTGYYVNRNGLAHLAMSWKKGTVPGFDIQTPTFINTPTQTYPHSLGVAPAFVILKTRNATQSWFVYHKNMNAAPASGFLLLQSTIAFNADTTLWNNTAPSATIVTVGSAFGSDGPYQMLSYLFAEVPGFSKFGSYTGNGSSDGPFVACNFRPRWLLIKRVDAGSGEHWNVIDAIRNPYNAAHYVVFANMNSAESVGNRFIDFLSNGFKLRDNNTSQNASGGVYVYCAFAEAPFKFARAR